jgi:hypothetical protein
MPDGCAGGGAVTLRSRRERIGEGGADVVGRAARPVDARDREDLVPLTRPVVCIVAATCGVSAGAMRAGIEA